MAFPLLNPPGIYCDEARQPPTAARRKAALSAAEGDLLLLFVRQPSNRSANLFHMSPMAADQFVELVSTDAQFL